MKVNQSDALQFTNGLITGAGNAGNISFDEINNSENMVVDGNLYPIIKKGVTSIKEFFCTVRSFSNVVVLVKYKNKDSFYLFKNTIIDTDGKTIFVIHQNTNPRRIEMQVANYTLYNTKRWIYFVIRNLIIPFVKDSTNDDQCECKVLRVCNCNSFCHIEPLRISSKYIDALNIINGKF